MPARKLARRKVSRERFKPTILLRKFLITVVLLLSFGFLWKTFASWQGRLWNGESRFTVVVGGEDPTVYSFNPATGSLVFVRIPKNTQVETAYGYGTWLIGSLWELGKQEGLGGRVLTETIKKTFGIPVDGYIDGGGEKLFKTGAGNFLFAVREAALSGAMETNLTFFDRMAVLARVGGTNLLNRREIDLVASRVVSQKVLSDGVEGYIVVSEQTRPAFEKNFRDDAVFQETKTLTVVNTTKRAGLAQEVARLASIVGIRVIGTETREVDGQGCVIRADPQALNSLSAQRLSALLGCERVEGETQGADLELFLNEEFAKRF